MNGKEGQVEEVVHELKKDWPIFSIIGTGIIVGVLIAAVAWFVSKRYSVGEETKRLLGQDLPRYT